MITTALQLSLSPRLCPPDCRPSDPARARPEPHRVTLHSATQSQCYFGWGQFWGLLPKHTFSSSSVDITQYTPYTARIWAVHTYCCAPRGTLLWCLQQMKEHIVTSSAVSLLSQHNPAPVKWISFFIFTLFTLILYGNERSWRHTEPCFIFLLNFRTLIKMQINSM